jgi:hypothetical protein
MRISVSLPHQIRDPYFFGRYTVVAISQFHAQEEGQCNAKKSPDDVVSLTASSRYVLCIKYKEFKLTGQSSQVHRSSCSEAMQRQRTPTTTLTGIISPRCHDAKEDLIINLHQVFDLDSQHD